MSTVVIRIGGDDITEHVIFEDAEFTSAARGRGGTARFRIRDLEHIYNSLVTGASLTLDVDGIRKWGGYVAKIERGYFFEVDCTCKVPLIPRYLLIDGVDYNVLLPKRVLYDKVTPTNTELTRFPTGTMDRTVLLYYLTNHTDLLADGVTTSLIEAVDVPFVDDPISGSAGWTVENFMAYLTYETGAIYYINPDKVFVLTDVDTPNAPKGISDEPDATEVGCRELEIDFDGTHLRNDALAWGVGQGNPNPVFARVQDAASIAEHGLWQVGDFNPTIWHQATVERIADSYVYGSPQNRRGGKDDRTSVSCTVFSPIFRVAQKVAFRSDVFGFSDVIPIRTETITFDTPTDPRFRLVLGHEIDDPWSTLEFWFPPFPPFPPFPDFILPDFTLPSFSGCPYGCEWSERGFDGFTWIPHWSPFEITLTGSQQGVLYGETIDPPPFFGKTMSNWLHTFTPGTGIVWKGGTGWREWGDLVPDWDTLYIFTLDRFHRQVGGESQSRVELVSGGVLTYDAELQQASLSSPQGIFLRFSTTASNHGYGWYSGGAETVIQHTWQTGVQYAIRIRLEGAATDISTDRLAKMKIWEAQLGEPDAWSTTRVFPSSPPSLTSVAVSGWTDTTPYSASDYNEVTFDYIGPYSSECLNDLGPVFGEEVDTSGGSWLPISDPPLWEFGNVSGLTIQNAIDSTGEFDVYSGGQTYLNGLDLSGDLPISIYGEFTILTKGQGSGVQYDPSEFFIGFSGSAGGGGGLLRVIWNAQTFPFSGFLLSGGILPASIQSIQMTWDQGQTYSYRIIFTGSSASAKIWKTSEEEPGYMLWRSGGSFPEPALLRFALGMRVVPGGAGNAASVVSFSQPIITSNTGGTGFCADQESPCSGEPICERMTPLTVGLTYEASFEWVPGTDQVWVDGLRLDYRDYTAHPEEKYIEFNDALINPEQKTVVICYTATCIGE